MNCQRCGATPPSEARFCPSCGSELAQALPHEERKLVSVLFVDQAGSTARAEGADPEDIRDLNRLYFEKVREQIESNGGVLEKYIGDAVMAVFGTPLSRSDDAQRAVGAALDILEELHKLNLAHPELNLHARAGVCTGKAVVEVDSADGVLATGDVVNTAARLQSAAPIGRVIVDAQTYELTKQAIRYEPATSVEAKGKRDPVPAWLAIERVDASTHRPATRVPLFGRDHELLLIRALWERSLKARQPQVISLIGPAGIGKSRLAAEISADVEKAGGEVLWGRSIPYSRQTPYHAVAQMVRHAAGIFRTDPVEVAREKLALIVGPLFPAEEVSSATRYLSLVLGLGLDERAQESVDLQYATRGLFENLSQQAPLLLVFDDVHWADEALLDLLDYLGARLHDHPIMMLVMARPEFLETRASWGAGMATHTALSLNPLTPEDSNEVVTRLLSGATDATIQKVVAAAEGNPLFIEELAASIEGDLTSADLPATVRAAIAARIDALPADARSALLRASVIGKTFWRGVLNQIEGVSQIDDALDALGTRGLIQRHSASLLEGDAEFTFKHDLVLDAAYETLPRSVRRQIHGQTAHALEATVRDPAEIAAVLAHHWREAGDADRARDYLLRAASRAMDALAVEETYDLFSQALALAPDNEERLRIKYMRGMALSQLEDFMRASKELGEILPDLDGEQKLEALIARTHCSVWTEQTEATIEGATQALELARAGGFAQMEAVALGLLSAGYGMRGEPGDMHAALTLGEQALELWTPGTRRADLAEFYLIATDNYYWTGDYPRAMEVARLSAETAGVEVESREFRLRGAGVQTLMLAGMGRYEEAIAASEDAMALAKTMGRPTDVVMNYSTLALREIFALEQALERSEEVATNLGPSDFNMPWMNARADAFTARVARGDIAAAHEEWSALWDDALASIAWERWLVSGRIATVRADLDLQMGNLDEAVTWARRAIQLAVDSSRAKYQAIALTTLGRALTAQGLREEAASELRRAIVIADRLGTPSLRWRARAALAEAAPAETESLRAAAASIINDVLASLSPERAAGYRNAPEVSAVLSRI